MAAAEPLGARLVRDWVRDSPFPSALSIRLEAIEPDRAELVLPFAERLVTYADVLHGGAIGTLVDVAAAAAAWSALHEAPARGGATVDLSVSFLRAARGTDVRAVARVVRRGGSICFCEVDALDAAGEAVAKALVTYKLG